MFCGGRQSGARIAQGNSTPRGGHNGGCGTSASRSGRAAGRSRTPHPDPPTTRSNGPPTGGRRITDCNRLSIRNFGPVEAGTIDISKVTVFFGPNNSGKSMVSKLIHAILLLEPRRYGKHLPEGLQGGVDGFLAYRVSRAVARSPHAVPTRGRSSSTITVESAEGTRRIEISGTPTGPIPGKFLRLQSLLDEKHLSAKQSLYIPAGRTGAVELFHRITQWRNRVLNYALAQIVDGGPLDEDSLSSMQKILKPAALDDIEQGLYDMVLDAYSNGVTEYLQDIFHALFSGQIYTKREPLPHIVFEDADGFEIPVENAGHGVMAALPILLGIDHAGDGGCLVIEGPEVHMEPAKQFAIMEELWKASEAKKLNLVLTTHSDFIVKKLLSMVSQGRIKPQEMGLYYFKRDGGQNTRIIKMEIDESGEAEQPLFQDALDSMVKEFSK